MIHRYWTGGERPREWIDPLPHTQSVAIADWTDDTLPSNILRWVDDQVGKVPAEFEAVHRSNCVRFKLLEEYGGIWVDWDVIPAPTEDFAAFPHDAWIAAHGGVCTCVVATPSHHPAVVRHVRRIEEATFAPTSMELSGEAAFIPMEMQLRQLPYDGAGRPVEGAENWATHLYHSTTKASTRTDDGRAI